MADLVGQQLNNYRLIRLLGRGGFAEVYLGEHIHLGAQAAIKVLHTNLGSQEVEQFRSEARTIVRLVHPHIVRVFDFDIKDGVPFLVMDYAPNGSLQERHPRGTLLPLPLVVEYVKQVADALQYAHDQRLIHRDVKPGNMLLRRYNEVVLSDFGIATIAHHTSSSQSTQGMAGTIHYMAPEQIQGKPRFASDQYALGVVVYEWLTGDRPFRGSFTEIAVQHIFASPPPLTSHVPTISPEVEQVVLTALAKDPRQRFGSVQAFATSLEQASQPAPTYSVREPLRATPPRDPTQAPEQKQTAPLSEPLQPSPMATSSHQSAMPAEPATSRPATLLNQAGQPPAAVVSSPIPKVLDVRDRPIARKNALAINLRGRPKPLLLLVLICSAIGLILLTSVSGYLFSLQPMQAKLNQASDFIVQARRETDKPNAALQNLARAQNELRSIQSSTLSQQQSTQYTNLQNSVMSEFKVALANYNKASLITTLPCANEHPRILFNGLINGMTPSTLATAKSEQNAMFYYLLVDNSLYSVNEHSILTYKYAASVVLLTTEAQHIFVLTAPNNQGVSGYELRVLNPGYYGEFYELANSPKATVPSELINQGFKPQLITTWDDDIYIVLTSVQSTKSNTNQAVILDYKRDRLQDAPQRVKIPISTGLVGVAAFPNKQLFLLHTDGTLKSLQIGLSSPSEIDVQSTQSIVTPWLVDAQQFTLATPIVAPPAPASSKLLSIPGPIVTTPPQSFLTAGQFDNAAHLYVTDNTNHRVLDLTMTVGGSTNQVAPTTPAATPVAGGKVDMQLIQQYTSPSVLPAISNSVVDLEGRLDLMMVNGDTVAIDVSQKNICSSQ